MQLYQHQLYILREIQVTLALSKSCTSSHHICGALLYGLYKAARWGLEIINWMAFGWFQKLLRVEAYNFSIACSVNLKHTLFGLKYNETPLVGI